MGQQDDRLARFSHPNGSLGYVRWGWLHICLLLGAVLRLCGWGVISSCWRKTFRFLPWLGACLIYALSFLAWSIWLARQPPDNEQALACWLWLSVTGFVAGGVAGGLGRCLLFWELYAATLMFAGGVYATWANLLPWGPSPSHLDWAMSHLVPGAQLLGDMWERQLGLLLLACLMLALVGSSLLMMLLGEGGKQGGMQPIGWFVAWRHLQQRQGRGFSRTAWISMMGMALGVAALLTVNAVMSGYQEDIRNKILDTNAHLIVQKYGLDFREHELLLQQVSQVQGVVGQAPFVFEEALIRVAQQAQGIMVKGVDVERAVHKSALLRQLCYPHADGRCQPWVHATDNDLALLLAEDGALPGILLGHTLLRRLGAKLGSKVRLMTPVGISGLKGQAPHRMVFEVKGSFQSGMHEYDARLAYLPMQAAQQLFGMGDTVSGIELQLANVDHIHQLSQQVLAAVGYYPYRILDWRQINGSILRALMLQKIVMFLVLLFIVVVAAFNICSTLFLLVVEKGKEIALLKALGAYDSTILRIFVLQGMAIAGLGSCLGIGLGFASAWLLGRLGLGIAADVYMVDSLQVVIRPWDVALVMGCAWLIAYLATLYPSLQAADEPPVTAMRYR